MVLGSWQLNTVVTVLFLGTSFALVQRCDQDHFCETGHERSLLLKRDNLLDRGLERNVYRQSNILDERWENDWRHTGKEDVTRDRLLRAEWHSKRRSSSEPGILGDKARFDRLNNPRITDEQHPDSTERLERSADLDLGSQRRGGVYREANQRHRELRQSRSINRREVRRSERFDGEESLFVRRERLIQDQVQRRGEMQLKDSAKQRENEEYTRDGRREIRAANRMRLANPTEKQGERRIFREHRGEDTRESGLVRAEARRGENLMKTNRQKVLRERTDREDAEIRIDSRQRISRDFVEVDKERDQRLLTFDRRVDQQDKPRQRTDLNTKNENLERSFDSSELREERISQTHRTDRRAVDRISNRKREEIAGSNRRRGNSLERLDRRNERWLAIRVDRRDDSVRREHSDRVDSMPLSNPRFRDFVQFFERQSADRAITADQREDSQDIDRLDERTENTDREVSRLYISREIRERIDESLVERCEERRRESVRATRNERHERDLERLSNERREALVRTEDLGQRVDRKDAKRVIRREYSQEEGTELARKRFDESAERIREEVQDVRRNRPDSREQNQRSKVEEISQNRRVVTDRQQEKRRMIVEISREQLQQSRVPLEDRNLREQSDNQAARREVTSREVVRANQRGRSSNRFSSQKREDHVRPKFTEDQRENSKERVYREQKNEDRFRIAIRNSDRAGDHIEFDNSRPIRLENSREQREKISRETVRTDRREESPKQFDHQEIRAISPTNAREDARRLEADADRYIEVEMLNHPDASTGEGHRKYSAARKLYHGHLTRSKIPDDHQEFTEKLELSINGGRFERLNNRDERHVDSWNQLDRETRQKRTVRDNTLESPRQFAPISKKAQTERREQQHAHVDTLIGNTVRTSERRERHVDDSMDYIQTFAKYAQTKILTVIQGTLLVVVFMKTLSFDNTKFGNGVFFKLMELSGMIVS